MPQITINNTAVEAADGQTILQAATAAGIAIPHYCFHPGLKAVGSCRMCQVEVEGIAKLQTACNTPVREGMVILTENERVRSARRAVMEFLLLNHPLDCPVCDQAGECGLQDYYMRYGGEGSRLADDKLCRIKAKPIGEHIILDQDRCILCTRCIRFCRDIVSTSELGVFHRGDRSVIDIYSDRQLINRYTGNLADICPVGALTDRDFRFQVRVWYLRQGDSICDGCSRGCNIHVYHNQDRPHHNGGRRIARWKPRLNPEVNRYWMCDEGRYSYRRFDEQRLAFPTKQDNPPGKRLPWKEILPEVAGRLHHVLESQGPSGVAILAAPQLANEDLYYLRQRFARELGISRLILESAAAREGCHDDFLILADKRPNRRGAQILGWKEPWEEGFDHKQMLFSGQIQALLVFGLDSPGWLSEEEWKQLRERLDLFVYLGTNECPASLASHFILPLTVHLEDKGTFTNAFGRTQRFQPVLEPLGEAVPCRRVLAELLTLLHPTHPEPAPGDLSRELTLLHPEIGPLR